ncbi:TPA: hypothetical protein ACH3X3_009428 [Trebouxia sp. C0006]
MQCMPTSRSASVALTGRPVSTSVFLKSTHKLHRCSCRSQNAPKIKAESRIEQDQSTQPGKRALLASLAALTILPLQSTPVLAFGGSKTVFVAGATGNTGKRVVQQLSAKGIQVLAGTRDPKKAEGLGWNNSVKLVSADVTSSATELSAAMKGADAVICAIGSSGFNPKGPKTVDYEGTLHLVEAAKKAGVKKFVLMSSLLTNGRDAGQGTNPNFIVLNLFGGVLDQKLKAEKYLRASGLDWTIVRPGGLSNAPPQELGNLFVGKEDTLFAGKESPGRSVSRETVAQVLVESVLQSSASNKVVEIVAGKQVEQTAPDRWFANL